jgi:predicted N-acetyltransferase YhbS
VIRIEIADIKDAEAILKVQKEAFVSEAEIYDDYKIAPLIQTLEELNAEFDSFVYLKAVTAIGEIVGAVRGNLRDNVCLIGRLIVSPKHQNQGIGRMLMDAIEGNFPDVAGFELFTGGKSLKNIHLYQKLGYKVIGEKKDGDVTMVVMAKAGSR